MARVRVRAGRQRLVHAVRISGMGDWGCGLATLRACARLCSARGDGSAPHMVLLVYTQKSPPPLTFGQGRGAFFTLE